jgi:hypothetical protein
MASLFQSEERNMGSMWELETLIKQAQEYVQRKGMIVSLPNSSIKSFGVAW